MAGTSRFFSRPRGRFFSTRDEQSRINRDMEAYQQVYGTEVDWYFIEHLGAGGTVVDDIYDEGFVEGGKDFHGPRRIPVLSAIVQQGQENLSEDSGFATFDRVVLRLSYEQARRAGLDLDLVANRESHLHDRFVFRRRVFDVERIQSSGHFQPEAQDTTVNIVGRQLRSDELYDSAVFQPYVLPSDNAVPY